jgi:CHAT domain-containing protein
MERWGRIFNRAPALVDGAFSAVGERRGLASPTANPRSSNHDLSHPDYWAAFAIFGLPDVVT